MTVNIVSVHDLGKINPNFQSDKMHHKWHEEVKPDPNIGSRHSILSSVFYLDYFLGKINEMWEAKQLIKKSEAEILKDFAYIYSYIISRHHGELKEFSEKWKECIYSSGKHKRNLLL
nr:CRISPR-associated endonuclease Cas3'' [Coprococcus comes]